MRTILCNAAFRNFQVPSGDIRNAPAALAAVIRDGASANSHFARIQNSAGNPTVYTHIFSDEAVHNNHRTAACVFYTTCSEGSEILRNGAIENSNNATIEQSASGSQGVATPTFFNRYAVKCEIAGLGDMNNS